MNKSDFRIFKLTRIIRANVIEEFFTPMEFPQEEKEEQKAKYPCITLAFPQSMSYRVYDEFGTDEIQQCDNGDFIVSAIMPVAGRLSSLFRFKCPHYRTRILKEDCMERSE